MPQLQTSTSSRLIRASKLDPEAFTPFGEVIQNPAAQNGLPKLEKVVANQGSAMKWLDVTDMSSHYRLSRTRKAGRCVMNMFVCQPRKLRQRGGKNMFPVEILERHPFTPQTFIPMGISAEDKDTCYLVIVAPTLPLSSETSADGLLPAHPKHAARGKRSWKEILLGTKLDPLKSVFGESGPSTTSTGSAATQIKGAGPPDVDGIKAFIARGDQAITYGPGTWHAPMVVLGEKAIDFVVAQYTNGVAVEDCQEMGIRAEDGGDGLAVDVGEGGMLSMSPKAKL